MAFAGHARSINLSHATLSSSPMVENVHPDRHRHIISDQALIRKTTSELPKHSKGYSRWQDDNPSACSRNHNDDSPLKKLPSLSALAVETDDKGNTPTKSLWIGFVPPDLTDYTLKQAFECFGVIELARAHPAKKCGFVNFLNIDSAISAWRECHEKDIFKNGVPVIVRYERPPTWLPTSLKRKRSSTGVLTQATDDPVRSSIPLGPRSQMSNASSAGDPKSQQTIISPPPLRRHNTYRRIDSPEDGRMSRAHIERRRQSNSYRPVYDDSVVEATNNRRDSSLIHDTASMENATYSQTTTIESHRSEKLRTGRSQTPPHRHSQGSRQVEKITSPGIGIKGLATASRAESISVIGDSNKFARLGISIRGTAAKTRADTVEVYKASSTQSMASTRDLIVDGKAPTVRGVLVQETVPSERPQPKPVAAITAENTALASNNDLVVITDQAGLTSIFTKSKRHTEVLADTALKLNTKEKIVVDALPPKEGLSFPRLNHLYELRESEKLSAQKARTISPFGRLPAMSREKSVESAKTDPFPTSRRLVIAEKVCPKCEVSGAFLERFKCTVPSCSTMLHWGCGNLVQVPNITASAQEDKLYCDECFLQIKGRNVGYFFVGIDSPMVKMDAENERNVDIAAVSQSVADIKQTELSTKPTKSSLGLRDEYTTDQRLVSESDERQTTKPTASLPTDPPIEPRSMRDEPAVGQAHAIAKRYKETVTCPWWRKGDSCVRHKDECIFAHFLTGIESPNGRSTARHWTCFDFLSPQGCRYVERDCLYSHSDTGLYVGVDGKASKKHLECYWWRYGGRCRYNDASCACAHHNTGLVAEEPMPRDVARGMTSAASFKDADMSQDFSRWRARSPSFSILASPATEDFLSSSVARDYALSLLQNPVDSQINQTKPKVEISKYASVTEAGGDPRLRGNTSEKLTIHTLPKQLTKDETISRSTARSTEQVSPNGDAHEARSHSGPQGARRSTMNPCKNCSKLIFKAEICTDCLKLDKQQDKRPTNSPEHLTGRENIEGNKNKTTLEVVSKPTTFAIPARKVLKRSRTTSSSNIFASKRLRPDMTAIRTAPYPSSVMSNPTKPTQPVTQGQLNRINDEKRAREAALAIAALEPDSSTIEGGIPTEVVRSPKQALDSFSKADSTTSTQRLNSCLSESRASPHQLDSHRSKTVKQGQTHSMKPAREIEHESEAYQSDSESATSDSSSDTDTPLASLRPHSENPLWSSSTSSQSPQDASVKPSAPLHRTVSASNGAISTSGPPTIRCPTCIRYHRKCVHTVDGDFDDQKCWIWREDRKRLGITHNAHYSEAERDLIFRKARAWEVILDGDHTRTDAINDDNDHDIETECETSNDEDGLSSPSDELQISHRDNKIEGTVSRRSASNVLHDSSRVSSRSPTSTRRQTMSLKPRSAFIIPEGMMLVPKEPPKEALADVIARLKAKGVVFEDSDTSDEEDEEELETRRKLDPRMDPLLYYKFDGRSIEMPIVLSRLTKGQGLKESRLIQRRQMLRNFHLFGNMHKQVDRQTQRQEVLAMVEKKIPDDILALPQQVEEKMTIAEFVGLQKGKAMEACLGKVALPRGKATMELAFREKDTEPGLGAWGRERRGNKKEKPVFVIGL